MRDSTSQKGPSQADHLEVALVFQAGHWRYFSRGRKFGRFSYKVDALDALPKLILKLRRRGWRGSVDLLIQQPWGELLRSPLQAA